MRHKFTKTFNLKGFKYLGIFIIMLFAFSVSIIVSAQEAIPATGGDASGSGGSVSYTIGQVFYTTSTGTEGSVAQGVQQPYEIYVISSIEEVSEIELTFSAYPNPTRDFLQLEVELENLQLLSDDNIKYQLFDMNGKLIKSDKVEDNLTTITMNELNPSTYFLRVISGNKYLKTFRIIKN